MGHLFLKPLLAQAVHAIRNVCRCDFVGFLSVVVTFFCKLSQHPIFLFDTPAVSFCLHIASLDSLFKTLLILLDKVAMPPLIKRHLLPPSQSFLLTHLLLVPPLLLQKLVRMHMFLTETDTPLNHLLSHLLPVVINLLVITDVFRISDLLPDPFKPVPLFLPPALLVVLLLDNLLHFLVPFALLELLVILNALE